MTTRHFYSRNDLLLLFSLYSSQAPALIADSIRGCLLSSHIHPQTMSHQPPASTSQGALWDQGEGSCAALLQQAYLCPASGCFWMVFEELLYSLTRFGILLLTSKDVNRCSLAFMDITSLHGHQIPQGGDIWAQFRVDSRCHKPPVFFWNPPPLLTLHIHAFHRNSPHAHPICSLPDQFQITSNNQLLPKCDYCPWVAGNREHSIKLRSGPALIKLDRNYLWK